MKPWVLIDTASVPGSGERLRLLQRDTEFSMRLDHTELMSSRVRGSEEALACLAIAKLQAGSSSRLLIGGLGMGFTLRATLDLIDAEARVTVAELIPAVVRWARGPMAALHGDSLDDPRVTVEDGDVGQIMRTGAARHDAILLDVDNGPAGLTRTSNDSLYGPKGLATAFAALRPGGVLAVWSAAPDPAFTQRLHRTGFAVDEHTARAHGTRGAKHTIWIAMRPKTQSSRAATPIGSPIRTRP